MANGIEEIITSLYEMIQDAWSVPLGQDKCVIERDKVLDLLDEISEQLPNELKQAKTIVESRNEVLTNAKREAENIIKQAEAKAQQLVTENEVYKAAQDQARTMIADAKEKIKELNRVTNNYVDNTLAKTEQSIQDALSQIKDSHAKFNALTGVQSGSSPIIEEV